MLATGVDPLGGSGIETRVSGAGKRRLQRRARPEGIARRRHGPSPQRTRIDESLGDLAGEIAIVVDPRLVRGDAPVKVTVTVLLACADARGPLSPSSRRFSSPVRCRCRGAGEDLPMAGQRRAPAGQRLAVKGGLEPDLAAPEIGTIDHFIARSVRARNLQRRSIRTVPPVERRPRAGACLRPTMCAMLPLLSNRSPLPRPIRCGAGNRAASRRARARGPSATRSSLSAPG